MSTYHQMGHDSKNLLSAPELSQFSGAILSPVNYSELDIRSQIESMRNRPEFEMIFDPQLYYPRSERGVLRQWDYFPNEVDTADVQSENWWRGVIDNLVLTCTRIRPDAACSPILAPGSFTDEYFTLTVQTGNYFVSSLNNSGIRSIQTLLCGLNDLSRPTRAMEIASIISQTRANTIFLVFFSSIVPRRELNNTEELKGAMRLISSLENAGLSVIVGFSSSELVLWKAAGATSCATGKFFNLRRFTSSRFEEPSEGGGQLPYWFEESLLAFLRESDIIRLRNANLLSVQNSSNPFAQQILQQMDTNPGQAWLALSWRQYLYAFADLERRLHGREEDISQLLASAEQIWLELEDRRILMEEARNNGEWIRAWRRALNEF